MCVRMHVSNEHAWLPLVSSLVCTDPVVSSLVLIVDPVEAFISAVLNTVLGDPFICVTAALRHDP